jgi:hypothetical protein
MKLDRWQEDVLNGKGNQCIRSGRQSGKSTVISKKAAAFACSHSKKTIMVIASVERQALLLFEKILAEIYDTKKHLICKGSKKPTKHKIILTNGSTIYCLPTGLSGYGIRGYTIDLLIADEAAFIPEEVWTAVTPMLAVTKGDIILLSTPFGKGGYFFRCFNDSTFTSFHVSSEDCTRISKEFLGQERKRMTAVQYAQEYLGEFVDELRQFFSTELVRSCMTVTRGFGSTQPFSSGNFYLGVDVARMGEDQTVMATVREREGFLHQVDMLATEKTLLTQTVNSIRLLDSRYSYRRMYIDDGGMGVGVFDPLLIDPRTKRRVVAINNASRSISRDGKRKKLLKEDLYNNLLSLMEQGKVQLFEDPEILLSLTSVQAEYVNERLRIYGRNTHIAEALIRACWCVRDKRLNIWIR